MASPQEDGPAAKRTRLNSTQEADDVTAHCREIGVSSHPEPTELPFARLRALQSFAASYDLRKDVNVCGRSIEVDLPVGLISGIPSWGNMISKRHFEILHDTSSKKTSLRDLSLNGTYINGIKLSKGEEEELKFGDVISFSHQSDFNTDTYLFSDIAAPTIYPRLLTQYYLMTGVLLGKGGYGRVELARQRANCEMRFAVKELHKERFTTNIHRRICKSQDIKNEVKLMMGLDSPNVVRLMDFIDCDDCSFIVLEFVGGGEFFELIVDPRWDAKGLGQTMGRFYAYQLISAVQYLHSHGVTHRDIKPENILLLEKADYTIAKLTDFGLAKSQNGSTMKTFCGTPCYIAPEIIENDRTPYREYVDIWSLGVVLFTAFSGYPPFSNEYDDMTLSEQIKKGRLILLSHWLNIDEKDQIAIRLMLSVDPLRRPSAKELLSMDWLQSKEAAKARRTVEAYQSKRVKYSPVYFTSLGTSNHSDKPGSQPLPRDSSQA